MASWLMSVRVVMRISRGGGCGGLSRDSMVCIGIVVRRVRKEVWLMIRAGAIDGMVRRPVRCWRLIVLLLPPLLLLLYLQLLQMLQITELLLLLLMLVLLQLL